MEKKGIKTAAQNRKAFHDYYVEEKYEAGIELTGTEVKSIRAGTLHAAQVMGMGEQLGSLEAGKLADAVLVDGDPLADISCLTHADHVRLVVKGGKIEKNTL